jgi:hypothetical protein
MQYYEPATATHHTTFQLGARGLLHDDVDLATIGIYPLADEQPAHDAKLQQLTNERVEANGENRFKLVWDVEYLDAKTVERELLSRVAERRYNEEVRGITWKEHNVDTNRDSQSKITNELLAIDKELRTDGKSWKMKSGDFVPLTNEQLTTMATAVHTHVSAMFDREEAIQKLIREAETADVKVDAFEATINEGWGNAAD